MIGHCTVRIGEQEVGQSNKYFSFQPGPINQESQNMQMEVAQIDQYLEHIFKERFPATFIPILVENDQTLKMEQISCFVLDHLVLNNGPNMRTYLSSNLGSDQNGIRHLSHINQPAKLFMFKINIQYNNNLASIIFE